MVADATTFTISTIGLENVTKILLYKPYLNKFIKSLIELDSAKNLNLNLTKKYNEV
jgi:hypothetical protein